LNAKSRTMVTAAALLAVLVLVVNLRMAAAHAVLIEASPAAGASVKAPEVLIRLRYNVRVEAGRSRVSLLLPDKSVKALTIEQQPSPDSLTAKAAGLTPGDYRIRWQVLASDGHITRGEVPFTVTP